MTLVAGKWSSLKSVPITCTKVRTRDRYLVHEPQHFFCHIVGGVISPILSNIYLDKLDQYVEHVLIPKYTRGERRAAHPHYTALRTQEQRMRRRGKREEAKALRKQRQKLPSIDSNDKTYRRLYYVRYADDTLLGWAGPQIGRASCRERV